MNSRIAARFLLATLTFTTSSVSRAETLDDLAARGVEILERVGADAAATKGDCDKLGAALATHLEADVVIVNKLAEAHAKLSKDERAAHKKGLKAKYGERIEAAELKLKAAKGCKSHDKVREYGRKVMNKL